MLVQEVLFVQDYFPAWEEIRVLAARHHPPQRVQRVNQSPSTAPVSTGLAELPPNSTPEVTLYRDANSWCPFCERVWFALEEKEIPFAVEFIDLSDKPDWYVEMVPTTLVPAAQIRGELVYESKAILLALEQAFEPALLPKDSHEKAIALSWLEAADANSLQLDDLVLQRKVHQNPEILAELKASVIAKLQELEEALAQNSEPYFLREFSLVDVMYSPLLDRLAANLPVFWGLPIKGNPQFPRLNLWFEALGQRPAYHRVKSDDWTNNLLFRRRYGFTPVHSPLPLDTAVAKDMQHRAEAADRLANNRTRAIADILNHSGIQSLCSDLLPDLQATIDSHLRLLAAALLQPDTVLSWGRVNSGDAIAVQAAAGAIILAYLRNRICAPRDMSAGAATALRFTIDQMLTSLY